MSPDEATPVDLPLAAVLGRAIASMWPRRAHQELLLDLGERKQWGAEDRLVAIDQAAGWLIREVGLPLRLEVVRDLGAAADCDAAHLKRVRDVAPSTPSSGVVPGVAAWVAEVAPALGVAPKTLANSLARPLRSDRADHRWIRAIGRVLSGDHLLDAWCFHRRSGPAVAEALAVMATSTRFDASDALLVVSLMALWQRRRPTHEAKGNRGRERSRRLTPKPVAALLGTLVQPGQAIALVELARGVGASQGAALTVLALEAALTEAHLAPHPTRSAVVQGVPGTQWLESAVRALGRGAGLLDAVDQGVFQFRIDRLRAWLAKRPQVLADDALFSHPYVAATLALEARIVNPALEARRFSAVTPGVLMLLPALRSKGMLEAS